MIMNEGHLLQFASPWEIVQNPADDFVKSLIDSVREWEAFWESVT
jgi:osmoprotectant transport system ATP-binding protein